MLNNMLYNSSFDSKNSYITQTDGIFHIIRKQVYSKNICSITDMLYITYMLYNILINIYNNMYTTYMLYNTLISDYHINGTIMLYCTLYEYYIIY